MNAKAEVRIRRQGGQRKCEVLVAVGGRQMVITLPDYDVALKWARMECKAYGIPPALPIVEVFDPLRSTAEASRAPKQIARRGEPAGL